MPGGGEGLMRLGEFSGGFADGFEAFAAGAEVGFDLFAQEAAGEFAQAGLGGEMLPALAFDVNALDGPGVPQPAQALAGGSAAEAQALGHVVEAERRLGAEKEAVDFAIGTGQREDAGDVDEDLDAFALEGVEVRNGA